MGIKEREWKDSTFSYRYGFNGQEKDDEVSGEGNTLDFGARIYDSRLGRWMSIDPQYVHYETPYSLNRNSPLIYVDKNLGIDLIPPPVSSPKSAAGDLCTFDSRGYN